MPVPPAAAAEDIEILLHDFFDGVVGLDERGRIASFNRAAQRLFGRGAHEMLGREAGAIVALPCREALDSWLADQAAPEAAPAPGGASTARELWGQRKDGSIVAIEVRVVRMHLGGAPRRVLIVRDVSEQKAQTEALEYQTLHDVLTGLPNRTLLNDRLQQAILTGGRERRTAALLVLDIDGFKAVNDAHGHHVGDRLLQRIALRLEGLLRSSDTVARLGGDEFAILPGIGMGGEDGASTAQRILGMLEQPFTIERTTLQVGASVGIALYPEHGRDAATLLRHADEAMYVAKRARTGFAFHVPRQQDQAPAHRLLAGELGHAIAHDELVLHFQPALDLRLRRTIGVEALVRWRHPERGLMLPMSFIPAAEEADLGGPLTRWVINQTLRQTRAWLDAGFDLDVTVNLSARSLLDPGLPEMTGDLLRSWRVDPAHLKVDIPESSIVTAPVMETAAQLGAMGIGLAVDDFGAGVSSLTRFARLPVREVKFDGALLGAQLGHGDACRLRPIVDLGHLMGLKMVAKGIEDSETLERLDALGCDVVQGYHVCPPLVADELSSWLQRDARCPVPTARR